MGLGAKEPPTKELTMTSMNTNTTASSKPLPLHLQLQLQKQQESVKRPPSYEELTPVVPPSSSVSLSNNTTPTTGDTEYKFPPPSSLSAPSVSKPGAPRPIHLSIITTPPPATPTPAPTPSYTNYNSNANLFASGFFVVKGKSASKSFLPIPNGEPNSSTSTSTNTSTTSTPASLSSSPSSSPRSSLDFPSSLSVVSVPASPSSSSSSIPTPSSTPSKGPAPTPRRLSILLPLNVSVASASSRRHGEDKVALRDRTKDFLRLRNAHRKTLEEDINTMLVNLSQLSIQQLEYELKGTAPPPPKPRRHLDRCARCRSPFDWSWLKLREVRNVCHLCRDVFCDSCGTASIDLHTINSSEKKPANEAQVCLNCREMVDTYYRRLNFEEMKRQAELNPIVNYYRDTTSLRTQVLALIDRYVEIVSTLSRIDEERFRRSVEQLEAVIASPPPSDPTSSTLSFTTAMVKSASLFKSFFTSPVNPTASAPGLPPSASQPAVFEPQSSSPPPPTSWSTGAVITSPNYDSRSPPVPMQDQETPEQLYADADALEREIVKSMNTYVQGVKQLSEIVVDSQQENEVIKHVKKAAIENVTENALTQKNLKRLMIQIDTRVLEKVYLVLRHLSHELSAYAFNGVLRNPIEKCADTIAEDFKSKIELIGDKWAARRAELESKLQEEIDRVKRGEVKQGPLGNLPLNSPVKRQATRSISVVMQLQNLVAQSIARPYLTDSVKALEKLVEEVQDYC